MSSINMKLKTKEKGNIGEKIAEKHLKNKGFIILERNFWTKHGEIDIVTRETGGKLVFFEVKSVSYETFDSSVSHETYDPTQNMHKKKLERLLRTIEIYIRARGFTDENFDLRLIAVSFNLKSKKAKVKIFNII